MGQRRRPNSMRSSAGLVAGWIHRLQYRRAMLCLARGMGSCSRATRLCSAGSSTCSAHSCLSATAQRGGHVDGLWQLVSTPGEASEKMQGTVKRCGQHSSSPSMVAEQAGAAGPSYARGSVM